MPKNNRDGRRWWPFESSYIRQARETAEKTGGTLILDKDIGLASVDISGTKFGDAGGGHLLQFRKGEYNYEKMESVGVSFNNRMLSVSSGWDYVKYRMDVFDQVQRGEGKYYRNGMPNQMGKFMAAIQTPVSITDAASVLFTGKNFLYKQPATSNFDKGHAVIQLIVPIAGAYYSGATVTILQQTLDKGKVIDGVGALSSGIDAVGGYDSLKK